MNNKFLRAVLLAFSVIMLMSFVIPINNDLSGTALILIDIQEFYFPGGSSELVNPETASLNAQKLLEKFRNENALIVHVRHNSGSGADIHKNVKPVPGEKVISKDKVNCFSETDMLEYLNKNNIKQVVICGMMTHMCVEAATRAASDFGFECVVVGDACATRNLKFEDKEISAESVHNSTLSSLSGYYAKVVDTETFLKN